MILPKHNNIYFFNKYVFIVLILITINISVATAQDAKKIAAENAAALENIDITKMPNGWKNKLNITFGLNGTNNYRWNGAAEKYNININLGPNLKMDKKFGKQIWTNDFNILLGGITSANTKGAFRKGTDNMQLSSTLASQIIPGWFAAMRVSLQSQLMPTYTYNTANTIDKMTSNFLSPGVFRAGLGFMFKQPKFKIYISPITVNINTKLDKKFLRESKGFSVDTGKTYRIGLGALTSIEYNTKLPKGISYKTKLDLFTDYTHSPIKVIDTDWNNYISMMLTKQISLALVVNFRYYHFIDPTIQFMQTTGLSGSFSF
jgi:hypothetical protein